MQLPGVKLQHRLTLTLEMEDVSTQCVDGHMPSNQPEQKKRLLPKSEKRRQRARQRNWAAKYSVATASGVYAKTRLIHSVRLSGLDRWEEKFSVEIAYLPE